MSTSKGKELMLAAEKKLGEWSFFNKSGKMEEAAEIYIKAASQYKIAKQWDSCAEAYLKAIELFIKMGQKYEAASNYVNVANAYRKGDISQAGPNLQKAVDMFSDEGKFNLAAKHQKDVAELYEEDTEYEKAIDAYQRAADLFESENSSSTANNCLLKVAHLAALIGKYDKAIEIYERVAKTNLKNPLLKWGVKDYFFRAGILYLANEDVISAKRQIEKYADDDPSFGTTREFDFLKKICAAYEALDVEAFTNAVVEYDTITKLDQWKTSLLLKVKNSIKKEDTGGLA